MSSAGGGKAIQKLRVVVAVEAQYEPRDCIVPQEMKVEVDVLQLQSGCESTAERLPGPCHERGQQALS